MIVTSRFLWDFDWDSMLRWLLRNGVLSMNVKCVAACVRQRRALGGWNDLTRRDAAVWQK
jgi:hypothetical protein